MGGSVYSMRSREPPFSLSPPSSSESCSVQTPTAKKVLLVRRGGEGGGVGGVIGDPTAAEEKGERGRGRNGAGITRTTWSGRMRLLWLTETPEQKRGG